MLICGKLLITAVLTSAPSNRAVPLKKIGEGTKDCLNALDKKVFEKERFK